MATRTNKKNTKVAVVETARKEEVLSKVKDLTPEKTGVNLARAQSEVMKQFADIQAKLAEQQQILSTTEQAIVIKQQELAELHNLSDIALAQATLEDQITATREQWNRDRAEHERRWQEEREEAARSQERETQDWEYEFAQTKRRRQQELTDELATSKRTHDAQVELVTKQLTERQVALANAEKELANLREMANTFDQRVAKEVEARVAVQVAAAKKSLEHEKAMAVADCNMKVQLAQSERQAALNEVQRLNAALAQAADQVASLQEDVKAISTAALEASSGRRALEAVQTMNQTSAVQQPNRGK